MTIKQLRGLLGRADDRLDRVALKRTLRGALRRSRVGIAFGGVNRLDLLMRAYGGSDKRVHGYAPLYERHVGPQRFKRNRVLEIGVGGYEGHAPGGSLWVWRDYLPRSFIVGMDVHDKTIALGSRVRFCRGDQSDPDDLDRVLAVLGHPDIVIDDGSHVGRHVTASFDHLWPQLSPGGVYVIEDLSTSYYPEYEGGLPAPDTSAVGFLKTLIDSVQAADNTFRRRPDMGVGPDANHRLVAAVHIYPGAAFVLKASGPA